MIKSDYDYYVDELTSLKRDGKVFADKYPEAAKQLNLGIADNLDPSVERIIESTAFLIGKIKKTTDESLHEISDYSKPCHPDHRPPYIHLMPLAEIIGTVYDKGVTTKTVQSIWQSLIDKFGMEIEVFEEEFI